MFRKNEMKEQDLNELIDIERTQQSQLLTLVDLGQYKQLEALLENGKQDINKPNESGDTAAILAAKRNDLDMLKLLTSHGADLSCENFFHQSAKTWAEKYQNKDMISFINDHPTPKSGLNI
jgi:ankyrin repeat protein